LPGTTPPSESVDGEVLEGGAGDEFVTEAGEASASCGTCTVLAAAENPQSLALDSTNVYWTDQGLGAVERVVRTAVQGTGTPLVSGLTGPLIISSASGWLVWSLTGSGSGQGTVYQLSTSSSTPTKPGTSLILPWGVAVDGINAYWVASNGPGAGAVVQSSALANPSASIVGTEFADDTPGGLAVNANNLFFAASSSSGGGDVFQIPIASFAGTPTSVWNTTTGHPQDVALDSNNLYWVDQGGGVVYSEPLGGGAATTLASGLKSPSHLAVDSTNVYVANTGAGTILEIPIAGGSTVTLASGLDSPLGIAVDNSKSVVYFTTTTTIESAQK
jgi:hypothetical protein